MVYPTFAMNFWRLPKSKKFIRVPKTVLIVCKVSQFFAAKELAKKLETRFIPICFDSTARLTIPFIYGKGFSVGVVFFPGVSSTSHGKIMADIAQVKQSQVRFHG